MRHWIQQTPAKLQQFVKYRERFKMKFEVRPGGLNGK
jgi:hypothetical protein